MPRSWVLIIGAVVLPGVLVLAGGEGKKKKPKHTVSELAWLSGSWSLGRGTDVSEVHWSRPLGGTMIGMSRWVTPGDGNARTEQVAFYKLEDTPKGVVLTWWSNGKPATRYELTWLAGESATFANSKTDGPNVVCYGIVDGKTLHERLEGKKGIPPSNMPYTRASADVRLP